jgi:glutaminase
MDSAQPVECDSSWEEDDKRKHYHRVQALIHNSLDQGRFPSVTMPDTVVDLFFRLRSFASTMGNLGSIAACIANSGRHPLTEAQICNPMNVKYLLALMYSAGCDSQSGEFSFKVGIPAKSSREGVILCVIPNLAGIVVASRSLNERGVSKGGLKFCFDFSQAFNCHSLSGDSAGAAKYDPKLYHFHTDMDLCHDLLHAAETGSLSMLVSLANMGFSLSYTDYDRRSAAHLAASKGHTSVLKYLFKHSADMWAKDRWGVTPLEEAVREERSRAVAYLSGPDLSPKFPSSRRSDGGSSEAGSTRPSLMQTVQRQSAPVAAKCYGKLHSCVSEETHCNYEDTDDV